MDSRRLVAVVLSLQFILPGNAMQAASPVDPVLHPGDRHYVLLAKDGRVLAGHESPQIDASPAVVRSANISIAALGIGALMAQGRIRSVDSPVHEFLPEWRVQSHRAVTIRMLLNHTSGLPEVTSWSATGRPLEDWLLAANLQGEPGKDFSYNVQAYALIYRIIASASGTDARTYLADHVLVPMGIPVRPAERSSAGAPPGFKLTLAGAARIGLAVLQGGRWESKEISSPGFIQDLIPGGRFTDEAGVPAFANKVGVTASGDDVYCANGYLGQLIVAVPTHGIIAVRAQPSTTDWFTCDDGSGFVDRVVAWIDKAEAAN